MEYKNSYGKLTNNIYQTSVGHANQGFKYMFALYIKIINTAKVSAFVHRMARTMVREYVQRKKNVRQSKVCPV